MLNFIFKNLTRKHFLAFLTCVLLQNCVQPTTSTKEESPACPYNKPRLLTRETNEKVVDSILTVLTGQLGALQKLPASVPRVELDLGIKKLKTWEESNKETSFYATDKAETITFAVDLLCTYWNLRTDTSITAAERNSWNKKFLQLDQQLRHFIFPGNDNSTTYPIVDVEPTKITPDPSTGVPPPPPSCHESIDRLEFTPSGDTMYIYGSACKNDKKMVRWVFVLKGKQYHAKRRIYPNADNENWVVTIPLKDYHPPTAILVMKFDQTSFLKLGDFSSSGYTIDELIAKGGEIIDQLPIPPTS